MLLKSCTRRPLPTWSTRYLCKCCARPGSECGGFFPAMVCKTNVRGIRCRADKNEISHLAGSKLAQLVVLQGVLSVGQLTKVWRMSSTHIEIYDELSPPFAPHRLRPFAKQAFGVDGRLVTAFICSSMWIPHDKIPYASAPLSREICVEAAANCFGSRLQTLSSESKCTKTCEQWQPPTAVRAVVAQKQGLTSSMARSDLLRCPAQPRGS